MPADERIQSDLTKGGPDGGRRYGIDMLRLLAMFMIPVLHVLGQGGVMTKTTSNQPTYYSCWLLEAACLCAVNCFALISGYVGSRASWKLRKIVTMMITVETYSLLITLVLGIRHPGWINRDVILGSIFPVQWKTWWYYTAYVGLFFLMPFLNKGVRALGLREKKRLMATLFVLFCVVTVYSKTYGQDTFSLVGGYSFLWIAILYVFGAGMRECEYDDPAVYGLPRKKARYILGYFALVAFAWLWKVIVEYHVIPQPVDTTLYRMFLTYTSPTLFGAAYCLVRLFSGIDPASVKVRKVLRLLTPSAFFIYLLHTHPLVWDYVLKGRFGAWCFLPPVSAVLRSLLAAAAIYIICLLVDLIRRGIRSLTLSIYAGENR